MNEVKLLSPLKKMTAKLSTGSRPIDSARTHHGFSNVGHKNSGAVTSLQLIASRIVGGVGLPTHTIGVKALQSSSWIFKNKARTEALLLDVIVEEADRWKLVGFL
jgi:hypothetical protein